MEAKPLAARGVYGRGPAPGGGDGMRPETRRQHHRGIRRAIDAMKLGLDEPLRLEELAEAAVMSPFHFNRVFREVTGIPPRRFLTALRLKAAKRLLVSTDLSVTEISLEVGYNSLGTFTRRFKELVGAAPARFRDLAQSGVASWGGRVPGGTEPPEPARRAGGLLARVQAAGEAPGTTFVGLFADAVPQGAPHACAVLETFGQLSLAGVPDGRYFLLAMSFPRPATPAHVLLNDGILRGEPTTGGSIVIRNARSVEEDVTIRLHPPQATDPPILTALPLLLARKLSEEEEGGTSDPVHPSAPIALA